MDTYAYIFVEVKQGTARDVSRKIAEIDGVKSSHIVTGPYDIIVFAKAPGMQQLLDLVIAGIQKTSGVLRTITNVVAE